MTNKPPAEKQQDDGIDLVAASGIILRVIADWQQSEYTEDSSTENGRQAEVRQHNDLSNPASGVSTTQG